MQIELTGLQAGTLKRIEGWIEGEPAELLTLFLGGPNLDLAALDSRLEGRAVIMGAGASRSILKGSGRISAEGRTMEVGDRVRITIGGQIAWS